MYPVNDSAVLTIYVIDENDEPPLFKESNNTLFEAVFFDAAVYSVVFNLADQVTSKIDNSIQEHVFF